MKTLTLNLHTLFEINIAYFQLLNEVFFSMDSNFLKFQGSGGEKHSQQKVEWKWYEKPFPGKLPKRERQSKRKFSIQACNFVIFC